MIDKIEIIISSGSYQRYNAYIDYHKKICYLNNSVYNLNEQILTRLKDIIYTFKKEYGNSNVIDIEEFEIIVTTHNQINKYHGKGIYPTNYQELINLLGEIK